MEEDVVWAGLSRRFPVGDLVRLVGIDAPEPPQRWGADALKVVRDRILDQPASE